MKTEEIGTLAELGVKAGDAVEYTGIGEPHFTPSTFTFNCWHDGKPYSNDQVVGGVEALRTDDKAKFRIISRADTTDDAPKTWAEMTDAEKGAIALEYVEGNVQVSVSNKTWAKAVHPFASSFYYRIRPEPKRETVTLGWSDYLGAGNGMADDDTHRITFNTIDGEPDCGSVKMEKL